MSIVISGTGLFTPPHAISNDQLVSTFNQYVQNFNQEHQAQIDAGQIEPLKESSAEFIEKASGIKQRYMMVVDGLLDPEVMMPQVPERAVEELSMQAEVGVAAAKQALENAGKTAADIDFVVVACLTPERMYPSLAIEIQNALGIEGAAFDMGAACSSVSFGLNTADALLVQGSAKCILMVNPEVGAAQFNFRDRDSHFIFGEASTAVVLEHKQSCSAEYAFEIIDTKLKTSFSNNIRLDFGLNLRSRPENINDPRYFFKQEGRRVFKEVVPMAIEHLNSHLAENNLTVKDLRRIWLHQANINMNRVIGTKLFGYEPSNDEAPMIIDEYANSASAGSMIAFHKHHRDFEPGDYGLFSSFGAGYSIGSLILRRV